MILQFSEEVIVAVNFTSFNASNLLIKIRPGAFSDISKLDFSWSLIDISPTLMKFKLFFDYPLDVSSNNV